MYNYASGYYTKAWLNQSFFTSRLLTKTKTSKQRNVFVLFFICKLEAFGSKFSLTLLYITNSYNDLFINTQKNVFVLIFICKLKHFGSNLA